MSKYERDRVAALEARIAELERRLRQSESVEHHFVVRDCKIAALEAELASVKAESLRIVKDGEALKSEDAHADHNFILHDGIVCLADYTTYGWVQVDGFVAEVYNDTIVQPVRLERWEGE